MIKRPRSASFSALVCGCILVCGIAASSFATGLPRSPGTHQVPFQVPAADTSELNYLLSLPEGYMSESEPWPLILFLHGGGERGDDLAKVLAHGPPKLAQEDPAFPFVVVSPQCAERMRWTYELKGLKSLLDLVLREYNVDPDRVYLTGLSLGGYGTWNMAMTYPDYFAAIAPMCGGGVPDIAHRLWDMPIWVFHGAQDTSNPLANNERMVAAVRQWGGDPKFTVYPDAGHDCWTASYANPKLYTWMLSHSRQRPAFQASASSDSSLVKFAVDGDPRTLWAVQVDADTWFQVDFGRQIQLDTIVLDSSGSPRDLTGPCKVSLSDDGENWRRGARVRHSTDAVLRVSFPKRVSARYVRIEPSTKDTPRTWSIHEFRLDYR